MIDPDIESFRRKLPIFRLRKHIISSFQKHQALIFLGETACGKSTQIPQYIFESHPALRGMIGCTQPRRIAAISLAQRVAQEKYCDVGSTVGYSVRFEDCVSEKTRIKYMTDGILLREAIHDRLFTNYSVIIMDEVHERTLNTDVLLGLLKFAQRKRKSEGMKPLRVILMSATMDVDFFRDYLGGTAVPVIYIEGRQHKVDVYHMEEEQEDYIHSTLVTLFQIHGKLPPEHGILIFLTGQEEIESCVKAMKSCLKVIPYKAPEMMICPLFAHMSRKAQLKVLLSPPCGVRKVVVATNIAETSLTIPGIRHVIDSGKIKVKNFACKCGVELLTVTNISQSQAWQRSGRAGREFPGTCYRLYTANAFENLPVNTVPEICRSNLISVALNLLSIGLTDLDSFDFITPPSHEALVSAISQLEILEAVCKRDSHYALTDVGRKLSKFPLDPRLGKCLIAADALGCLEQTIKIVSLLSVESVVQSSIAKQSDARQKLEKFSSRFGDHITYLNIAQAFRKAKNPKTWCGENFLSLKNLKFANSIAKQLREICAFEKMNTNVEVPSNTNVIKSIVAGFFMNAAKHQKDNLYFTIIGRQPVQIHPSSVLFNERPKFVVYNEIVKTSRNYMRCVTSVDADWLLEVCPAEFKYRYLL